MSAYQRGDAFRTVSVVEEAEVHEFVLVGIDGPNAVLMKWEDGTGATFWVWPCRELGDPDILEHVVTIKNAEALGRMLLAMEPAV